MRRLHESLARLLPAAFRRRYGDEMRGMLAAREEELSGRGRRRRLAFWLVEIADLLRTLAREWGRSARGLPAQLAGDSRFAVRTLARQPGFTVAVVLTLGLGIGATTAVYTLVDSVLLTPLPYEDPDRLVLGLGSFPLNDSASVSPPDYLDYRDRATSSFEAMAAFSSSTDGVTLGGGGAPERVPSRGASHELFETLGVDLQLGRGFQPSETVEGAPRVVVISDGLWRRRHAGDPGLVGGEILVNDEPATVVGILPAGFRLFQPVDVWRPLPFGAENMTVRRFHFLRVVGRLRDGVDRAAAQAELDAIAADLEEAYPGSNSGWTLRLESLHQAVVGDVRQPLILLLAAVAGVLTIACCNVAVLLLARTTRRAPELAVRSALGAGTGRIVRMILAESLVLSAAGGLLGVGLASAVVGLLARQAAGGMPRLDEVGLDGSVLAFSAAVTLAVGVLFGIAPALRSGRGGVAGVLRGQGRVAGGGVRTRNALVIAQVALSFTLLVGAGLTARSLVALRRVEPGFAADEVTRVVVDLPEARYRDDDRAGALFDSLLARLEGTPVVDSVAGVDIAPLSGGNDTWAYPEGEPPPGGAQGQNAEVRSVTPGYFATMGIPLLRGRGLRASDAPGNVAVVVLDQPFAEALFPEEDPLGRRIVVDVGRPLVAEVVGIAAGIHHYGPVVGATGTMYFPFRQRPVSRLELMLRTSRPQAAVTALREILADLDPQVPVGGVATLGELLDGAVAQPRFRARLLGVFATAALLLAAAGLHGVLACFVSERRREMGLRLALGADGAAVVRLVAGRGLRLVLAGMLLGVLGAAALASLIQGLLFGVEPADPASFAGVAALLGAAGAVASLVPAWRATRVDPVELLRA